MERLEIQFDHEKRLGAFKKAVLSGDFDQAMQSLKDINEYLTGDTDHFFPYKDEVEMLVKGNRDSIKVYLADGGMSRLIISRTKTDVHFQISEYNSSKSVKEKWKQLVNDEGL